MASAYSPATLLIQNGFIKNKYKAYYTKDERTGRYKVHDDAKIKMDSSHADQEIAEEGNYAHSPLQKTPFPTPFNRYRIVYESFNLSMEETYYWFLGHLRQDWGYVHVDKLVDIFSASENSAFFGQSAQRLSIQEDRASNFLRAVGQMVKELFQLVRELRVIDERLEPYLAWETSIGGQKKHSKSADVTLKGVFADFAENKGGQMQPGSLYHLAQTVGYSSLPDLFFNTHVWSKDDVDKVVDKMEAFNPNVRNVLKRKMFQYLVWKEKTEDELKHRRTFLIRYLRQHWATIKMYMNWTKPYLRHIKRLQMNEHQLDSPDLVSAFESSMTEVEVLFHKPIDKGHNACVLATFQFSTRPVMQYRQEQFQGPVHVGRVIATMRAYGWNDEQIANYKRLKEDEDKELLRLVDDSVSAAMEELGDDLEKYINMKGEDIFDEEISQRYGQKPKVSSHKIHSGGTGGAFEPLTALLGGFKEIFTAFVPSVAIGKPKGVKSSFNDKAYNEAAKKANFYMWQTFKNYKKSHGLLSW